MGVGKGCTIEDKWIPKGIDTNVLDINGRAVRTADKVKLNGCTSGYAIVGRDMFGGFVLYFGSDNGSVSWDLTQELVEKRKIKVVQ